MREIEFRAWCKKENKMFYNVEHEYDFYEDCESSFGDILDMPERYEVMQYVGIKDKNGKKIFEGDIVKLDEDEVCFIEWDKYDYSYRIKNKEVDDILSGFRPKDFEVIGNIYENPELLEVEDA